MFGIKKDIQLIRESQIRMEEDLKYHIKRTDTLEDMVKPIHKVHQYITATLKALAIVSLLIGLIIGINRVKGAELAEVDYWVSYLEQKSGCKLKITSGYRTKEENKRVKGAPNSYHLKNMARDLKKGKDCPYSYTELAALVYPHVTVFIYSRHLHIDTRPGKSLWRYGHYNK